jgi:hypothetical protein
LTGLGARGRACTGLLSGSHHGPFGKIEETTPNGPAVARHPQPFADLLDGLWLRQGLGVAGSTRIPRDSGSYVQSWRVFRAHSRDAMLRSGPGAARPARPTGNARTSREHLNSSCFMIMGRNGPHLAKTAHDHGPRPKCPNVKLRPSGFHVIVDRCLVLSQAAVHPHAAAAALCFHAVPPPGLAGSPGPPWRAQSHLTGLAGLGSPRSR